LEVRINLYPQPVVASGHTAALRDLQNIKGQHADQNGLRPDNTKRPIYEHNTYQVHA